MIRCPLAGCWRFPTSESALCLHLFAEHGFGSGDAGEIAADTYAGHPPRLLSVDGQLVNFAERGLRPALRAAGWALG